jgi:hypothetical protein
MTDAGESSVSSQQHVFLVLYCNHTLGVSIYSFLLFFMEKSYLSKEYDKFSSVKKLSVFEKLVQTPENRVAHLLTSFFHLLDLFHPQNL